MLELFHKGGPIMWPLLVLSIVALTVAMERIIFIARERLRRKPVVVGDILTDVERGDLETAARAGAGVEDFVARALTYALTHRGRSFPRPRSRRRRSG